MTEILDVVNREDEIIGQAERDDVHKKGLICRMVYVCFYTPNKNIILQRRSDLKKSNPGKYTTTVSGHVESGSNYMETAVKETFEETGVRIVANELTLIGKQYAGYVERGGYISNGMRTVYLYEYKGDIKDLRIEKDEGAGFELFSVDDLRSKFSSDADDFVPFVMERLNTDIIEAVERL